MNFKEIMHAFPQKFWRKYVWNEIQWKKSGIKRIQLFGLSCEHLYHSTSKSQVTDRIFKLSLIHELLILSDSLKSVNFYCNYVKLHSLEYMAGWLRVQIVKAIVISKHLHIAIVFWMVPPQSPYKIKWNYITESFWIFYW